MDEIIKNLFDDNLVNYNEDVVPKISVFTGKDITSDVYYFKENQVLKTHRHPHGEQIFIFLKGEGKMTVGDVEKEVKEGSTVMVKAGEWHEIVNGSSGNMVAVQVTKVDAGAEYK